MNKHKIRSPLKILHGRICGDYCRHISQKSSAIHKVFPRNFVSSDEKISRSSPHAEYLEVPIKEKAKKTVTALIVGSIWLILWQVAVLLAKSRGLGILLPAPLDVLYALFDLMKTESFYTSCAVTLCRVLAGWGIGLAAGTLLGVLTVRVRVLNIFFSPVLHAVKATPVASFIVLALVLFKSGFVPVFTGALMSLPLVWANIVQGLSTQNRELSEMAQAFCMSKKNRFRYLRLPVLRPFFVAAATTSMGLSWKAVVAAEVICNPAHSIGQALYNAKIYLETPELFAWTIAVILLSILLEKGIKRILR